MLFSIVALALSPVGALATENEEAQIKEESAEISTKIDKALDSVNAKYQEVETLKAEVSKTEQTIADTKVNIAKTEENIEKRTEAMGSRLQSIQSNGSSVNLVDALLDSENVSDFINRAYAMTVLQGAEKAKVDTLASDKEKLEQLKVDLEKNQEALTEKQTTMSKEATNLEEGVASLKVELSNNQVALDKLSSDRIAQEAQVKKAAVEEANRKEVAKKAQEQAEKEKNNATTVVPTSNSVDTTPEKVVTPEPVEETVTPSTPEPSNPGSSNGGNTMNMVATGYSYTQPGLGFYTAYGIDLRQNSRVIAVDKNVIPLGTLVEVSGYGMAIAGDTGGDIVGNRIDLHFNTVDECINFGRQNVTLTIL